MTALAAALTAFRPGRRRPGHVPGAPAYSRMVEFLGYLTERCQGGRRQRVEQVVGDRFPVPVSHPGPRGRPPGRSRRLPGLPGPGQRGRGRRGLVRRRGAARRPRAAARWRWRRPSAGRSGGWGRRCPRRCWVKASWISWKNSGSRDGATVATAWRRAGSDRAGMGINGSSPCGCSAVISAPPPLTSSNRIGRARPRGGIWLLEMAGP